MSELVKSDNEYALWIKDVSKRFKNSQIKAAIKVNDEMLRFYWQLGRDISIREKDNHYGKAFIKSIGTDLQKILPDVKSFSVTNLHYMKWFYELYPNAMNLPQLEVSSEQGIFDSLGT
ncbi:MAG: hypothetical protein IKO41_09530 [Lachnospiraceae bacterium]|nr:hypothetical protein [Lachnospiraceae bacterium]MBR4606449.1 hypothetical protein [Lachnospiraceae bacterium]MBR6152403.1 hypothetical protein [Lachnospiraceae bacterium]